MLLLLDGAFRGEAEAHELARDAITELGLGEEQEVVRPAPEHGQRRDQPCLGREQQRLAGFAESE